MTIIEEDEYSGQVLYHYANEPAMLGILKSGCIRATAILDLADETELIYGRDLVAERFEIEAKQSTESEARQLIECAKGTRDLPAISPMIRRAGYKPKVEDAKFDWYVACFSAEEDSLPLWRGFTRNCTGYAIGFRYTKQSGSLFSDAVHAAPRRVIYSEIEQDAVVRKTVEEARRRLNDHEDLFGWTIPLGSILTLKKPLFSSEQEWRVIWRKRHDSVETEMDGCTNGKWTPKGRITRDPPECHYVGLPLSDWELVKIICGPRSRLGPKSRKIRAALKEYRYQSNNVEIVQSKCRLWR